MKLKIVAIMLAGGLVFGRVEADVTYTFDKTTAGPLTSGVMPTAHGNQDGWYSDNAAPQAVFNVTTGSGAFSSKNVIEPSGLSKGAIAFRLYDKSFFSSSTPGADIEVDFALGFNASNFTFALTGNGSNLPLDNNVGQTKFSPTVAITSAGPGGITFRLAPLTGSGYGPEVTQTIAAVMGNAYAVRLTIDFTANNGDGSGTLSYKDLTANGAWTELSSIKNVNLGLTHSAPGYDRAEWNQVHIYSNSANTLPNTGIEGFSVTAHP